MSSRVRASLVAAVVVAAAIAVLLAMGRPPICTCGTVALWEPSAASARTSQMLPDWYSPNHLVHGLLFYAGMWLAARNWSVERRFLVALLVEVAWEVAENTPMVIDRYREATIALGYTGDSVLNSVSDMAMMAVGFLAARKLPLWVAVALVAVLEIVPLLAIRDNLTLNVWMLVWPSEAIRSWQAG